MWIDLEMTGLDPERGAILEIGSVVTDGNLEIVAEGPNIAINHLEATLLAMDGWSKRHHEASGLLDRVKASEHDSQKAEQETLEFFHLYFQKGQSPLCGNSVWQDRRFLAKHMPLLNEFFHYRNIDVSSIKELARRWYPSLPPFKKQKAHLSLLDIMESIDELKYYRQKIFLPTGQM
ncbi:MAG: oligoribonuclease [Desulfobacterales bacterium C00003060]|nr:MAG: oligoribonuclease [Desulfobacterales bacterium C00003060]